MFDIFPYWLSELSSKPHGLHLANGVQSCDLSVKQLIPPMKTVK